MLSPGRDPKEDPAGFYRIQDVLSLFNNTGRKWEMAAGRPKTVK